MPVAIKNVAGQAEQTTGGASCARRQVQSQYLRTTEGVKNNCRLVVEPLRTDTFLGLIPEIIGRLES